LGVRSRSARVRISFDLDDTLICYREGTPCEPRPPWHRRLLAPREPLRLGTCSLVQTLSARGWEVWVYTTSHRSPASIRRWLRSYGIRVARVVTQQEHDRLVWRPVFGRKPSKNPAAFGIDLHVDDSDGVRVEGEQHAFRVVVVGPHDTSWVEKVLAAAETVRPTPTTTLR
jgi:hypothetical protein